MVEEQKATLVHMGSSLPGARPVKGKMCLLHAPFISPNLLFDLEITAEWEQGGWPGPLTLSWAQVGCSGQPEMLHAWPWTV